MYPQFPPSSSPFLQSHTLSAAAASSSAAPNKPNKPPVTYKPSPVTVKPPSPPITPSSGSAPQISALLTSLLGRLDEKALKEVLQLYSGEGKSQSIPNSSDSEQHHDNDDESEHAEASRQTVRKDKQVPLYVPEDDEDSDAEMEALLNWDVKTVEQSEEQAKQDLFQKSFTVADTFLFHFDCDRRCQNGSNGRQAKGLGYFAVYRLFYHGSFII